VPKKDAVGSVTSMLSTAGQRYRPSDETPARAGSPAAPGPVEEVYKATAEPVRPDHLAPVHTPPVGEESAATSQPEPHHRAPADAASTPSTRRTRPARSAAKVDPQADNAPRTIRLSQPRANTLRDAWLQAKRDDLLLTYQDFADRVVDAGLNKLSEVDSSSK
jgi:hypothetical protein